MREARWGMARGLGAERISGATCIELDNGKGETLDRATDGMRQGSWEVLDE